MSKITRNEYDNEKLAFIAVNSRYSENSQIVLKIAKKLIIFWLNYFYGIKLNYCIN
jgi:hypothetical protein